MPLLAALAVFSAVLISTPPGFASITDVLLGSPRGPRAEAAAYALGAAGSLALLALVSAWALCALFNAFVRRSRR